MDLSQQPAWTVTKQSQTGYGRNKPTAKQRGDISTKVTKQLRERSGGICERCKNALAVQRAHTIRRWKVEYRTTVQDLVHLCLSCHNYADNTRDGRKFLEQFRNIQYAKLKYGDDWAEGLMLEANNELRPSVGD